MGIQIPDPQISGIMIPSDFPKDLPGADLSSSLPSIETENPFFGRIGFSGLDDGLSGRVLRAGFEFGSFKTGFELGSGTLGRLR